MVAPRLRFLAGVAGLLLAAGTGSHAEPPRSSAPHPDPLVQAKLEWFQDQKFGLLMHWGPYTQWQIVESWSLCPRSEEH
ncbi:MAG: alpha-L-fucosidase, partial [Candidatus Krumholzibacteriia bacterium]